MVVLIVGFVARDLAAFNTDPLVEKSEAMLLLSAGRGDLLAAAACFQAHSARSAPLTPRTHASHRNPPGTRPEVIGQPQLRKTPPECIEIGKRTQYWP